MGIWFLKQDCTGARRLRLVISGVAGNVTIRCGCYSAVTSSDYDFFNGAQVANGTAGTQMLLATSIVFSLLWHTMLCKLKSLIQSEKQSK